MLITVPGNILLLGEYAILEPGGQGVALAVDKYVTVKVSEASSPRARGMMGEKRSEWTYSDKHSESDVFLQNIFLSCEEFLVQKGYSLKGLKSDIEVDSSDLFSRDGKKLGLGSSAAVTLGLVFALLCLAIKNADEVRTEILPVACEAHTRAQGRSTSGYDITTSLFGGIGLFTQGTPPSFKKISHSWDAYLGLLRGDIPVSTPKAINQYVQWKEKFPKKDKTFLDKSGKIVSSFCSGGSWKNASRAISEYRGLGIWIGGEIGVETEGAQLNKKIQKAASLGLPAKAVGAGGELGLVISDKELPDSPDNEELKNQIFQRVRISKRGLEWKA